MQGLIFGEAARPKKRAKTIKKPKAKKLVFASQIEVAEEPAGEAVPRIFTVSEFLDFVNAIFKREDFVVTGEISDFNEHPSGCYFSLKDRADGSILNCYMNPYVYRTVGLRLEDGMEVKIGGAPNVYKPKGRLSFVVRSLELVGEGSLKKAYEATKKKLEEEGLFDRKRPLPEFISKIGIITSRTGAVIGDFKHNVESRGFHLSLYDVRVEGARAADEIVRAVKWFNANMPDLDVLVVMRGGGSLEDLQAFNNELVARAVFGSRVPTICAIGHDRDVPIVSLVGDAMTSTPTAAAVLVNRSWQRLTMDMPRLSSALTHAFESHMQTIKNTVRTSIEILIGNVRGIFVRYTHLMQSLGDQFAKVLLSVQERIIKWEQYLGAVSPERNLKLGYSIIVGRGGKVIKRASELAVGDEISAQLYEGRANAKVTKIS